jgi:DNA mismatch endonuclease (patch repair protein)
MADNLTPQQRSYMMSRVRSKNTSPELILRRLAHRRGLRFRVHFSELPGCPDMVFAQARVVVFIDGDFWHGWRFPQWREKLSEYWDRKIAGNRKRDQRNFRRLRQRGWLVVRVWEHQIKTDPEICVRRIEQAIECRRRLA